VTETRRPRPALLLEVEQIDRAVYAAVAGTSTPRLDGAMRRLSNAADHSKLSIAAAGMIAATAGTRGRKAAMTGLAAVAVTSASVNGLVKPLARRRRPNREAQDVPVPRHVPMPTSRSFPSGHTAAAIAFASGVGATMPLTSVPLHVLATVVAYSRVHSGVHYPGDVLAGALIGAIVGDATANVIAGAVD
jgi:membrane-associated phospholipid phosphatase